MKKTLEEFLDFLKKRMKPSHIYQPVMIKTLIDCGGSATVRQIAQAFLLQDESQIQYYEERVKEMPIRVLKKHGIVEREGDLVRLNVNPLTLTQKAEVRRICEDRLQSFIAERGLGIWDHRMIEDDPVADSLRYQVLQESGGRCALCGATAKDAVLQVDHIVPRSRGGSNEKSNLQVLCQRCNGGKNNKDQTDFRSWNVPSDSGLPDSQPSNLAEPDA